MTDALHKTLSRNLAQAIRQNHLQDAEALLAQLKRRGAQSVEVRGLELELLLKANRSTEARSLARELIRKHSGSSRIHYLFGRLAYRDKDYVRAAAAFRESHRLHQSWYTDWWLAKTQTQAGTFDEAEAILLKLCPQHPVCERDLAWLYERKGEIEAAQRAVASYLKNYPDDSLAQAQQTRLSSRQLSPQDLVTEVDTLRDLGQDISPALLPDYLQGLLVSGELERARTFVSEQLTANVTPRLATQLAWTCHRLQRHELAMDLFCHALPSNLNQVKMFTALEADARHCKREEELIAIYQRLAEQYPQLFGRAKRLAKRAKVSP